MVRSPLFKFEPLGFLAVWLAVGITPLTLRASGFGEILLEPRQGSGVVEVVDAINLKTLTVITQEQFGVDVRARLIKKRKTQFWLRVGMDRMIFIPPSNYGIINLDQTLLSISLGLDYHMMSRLSFIANITGGQVPVFQYANNQASQVLTEFWPSINTGFLLRLLQLGPFNFKIQGTVGYLMATQTEFQGRLNYQYSAVGFMDFQYRRWGFWGGAYLQNMEFDAGTYTQSTTELGIRVGLSYTFPKGYRGSDDRSRSF
jgi:hypothetical protein